MPSAAHGAISFFDVPVADADRARSFFGALFGWHFAAGNFPGYDMIPDATPPGGLDATGGAGAIRVYFQVDDIEAAVGRVRELGGTAADPVQLPSGRFAACADDQGTSFRLWQD